MKATQKVLAFWRWLTTYKKVDYSKPWYKPEVMHGLPGLGGDLNSFHNAHDIDMKRMDLFANKPLIVGKLVGFTAPMLYASLGVTAWLDMPQEIGPWHAVLMLVGWVSMLASVSLLVRCARWETASVEVPLSNSQLRVKILMELADREEERAAKVRNADMTRGTKSLLVVKRSGLGEH